MKISAVIITMNEEKYITRCIESLQGMVDEILVLDSFSSDATELICRGLGVRFEQHPFDGYVAQKNRAMGMASYDWILSLDGDEALSEELKVAILELKRGDSLLRWNDQVISGFIFNRRNNYCGRWMRFTSWYPDRKLRLFYRPDARWVGYDPHDHVVLSKGRRANRLNGDLLHWATDTPEEFRKKCDHFARISARSYHRAGKTIGWTGPGVHGSWRWMQEYVWRLGFLEGVAGWQIARGNAMNAYRKYMYLRILQHGKEV